jgi:hypothetical protein
MTFMVDNTNDLISFLVDETPYGGPPLILLDNIQLAPAPCPNLPPWCLIGIGIVGYVGIGLRRRARAAAV